MEIRRYQDSDYQIISSWYRERNLIPLPREILPPIGFVVPDVACTHLYLTDGKVALFEGFISNPDTTRKQRVQAFDLIMETLLFTAKQKGYKMAVVLANHPAINEGCLKARFTPTGEFKMFSKEL
jgi:hypothetical protein